MGAHIFIFYVPIILLKKNVLAVTRLFGNNVSRLIDCSGHQTIVRCEAFLGAMCSISLVPESFFRIRSLVFQACRLGCIRCGFVFCLVSDVM